LITFAQILAGIKGNDDDMDAGKNFGVMCEEMAVSRDALEQLATERGVRALAILVHNDVDYYERNPDARAVLSGREMHLLTALAGCWLDGFIASRRIALLPEGEEWAA
jgi:hypothetical protein